MRAPLFLFLPFPFADVIPCAGYLRRRDKIRTFATGMKVKFISVGSVRTPAVAELCDNYLRRAGFYFPLAAVTVADVRMPASTPAEKVKDAEGTRILAQIAPGDSVVLLDERGKEFTSRDFAGFMERKLAEQARALVFVIGGPFGFGKSVYDRADMLMGLSRLTLPHELARLFFAEQLYRAGTIIKGEHYHHD